jgi:hypothetical protein
VVGEIGTTELLFALCALEESPWGEERLTARRLAAILKTFGVKPGQLNANVRGYKRQDFGDAWNRHLTPTTEVQPVNPSEASIHQGLRAGGVPRPDTNPSVVNPFIHAGSDASDGLDRETPVSPLNCVACGYTGPRTAFTAVGTRCRACAASWDSDSRPKAVDAEELLGELLAEGLDHGEARAIAEAHGAEAAE